MKGKKQALSKTSLMQGLQCPKALYLALHNPELKQEVSPAQQAVFEQGKVVGLEAQKCFPGGVTITAPYYDTDLAIAQTSEAVSNGAKSIFEATFSVDGQKAKIDVLHRPKSNSPWSVIEVKSSTSVKREHLVDVAIQQRIVEASGCKTDKAFIMHINNQATAPELENLFIQTEVTNDIIPIKEELPAKIRELETIIASPKAPEIDIGPHCDDPYECPFKKNCWKHIASLSVFEIPRIGEKAWDLYKEGIISINDPRFVPSKTQKDRIEAVRTGKRFIDKTGIAEGLKAWQWPLYYFDFETINYAIPKYPGTRPYQHTPTQFSCLIQDKPGGELKEVAFLHDNDSDPRPPLIAAMLKALNGAGNIVAYNKGFEIRCIEGLAEYDSKKRKELLALTERFVDPLPIFRDCVYDKAFGGSFSIKEVAPALLGTKASYDGMEIGDGLAAQRGFLELISPTTTTARKAELRKQMLEYCYKDTKEMVDLVAWLLEQTKIDPMNRKKKAV